MWDIIVVVVLSKPALSESFKNAHTDLKSKILFQKSKVDRLPYCEKNSKDSK